MKLTDFFFDSNSAMENFNNNLNAIIFFSLQKNNNNKMRHLMFELYSQIWYVAYAIKSSPSSTR